MLVLGVRLTRHPVNCARGGPCEAEPGWQVSAGQSTSSALVRSCLEPAAQAPLPGLTHSVCRARPGRALSPGTGAVCRHRPPGGADSRGWQLPLRVAHRAGRAPQASGAVRGRGREEAGLAQSSHTSLQEETRTCLSQPAGLCCCLNPAVCGWQDLSHGRPPPSQSHIRHTFLLQNQMSHLSSLLCH